MEEQQEGSVGKWKDEGIKLLKSLGEIVGGEGDENKSKGQMSKLG